jgi:hypothetical protein
MAQNGLDDLCRELSRTFVGGNSHEACMLDKDNTPWHYRIRLETSDTGEMDVDTCKQRLKDRMPDCGNPVVNIVDGWFFRYVGCLFKIYACAGSFLLGLLIGTQL